MLTLIAEGWEGTYDDRGEHVPSVYLHGTLERAAGYDLVCAMAEVPSFDGVRRCRVEVKGSLPRQALMFSWLTPLSGDVHRRIGLVVALDDAEGLAWAARRYYDRPSFV